MAMSEALKVEVKERISSLAYQAKERVINQLVDAEITKRAAGIIDGLTKRDEAQKELYKIKADHVTYDINGVEVQATFTKAKLEERTKILQKIEKIDKALDAALDESPDFTKLYEVIK